MRHCAASAGSKLDSASLEFQRRASIQRPIVAGADIRVLGHSGWGRNAPIGLVLVPADPIRGPANTLVPGHRDADRRPAADSMEDRTPNRRGSPPRCDRPVLARRRCRACSLADDLRRKGPWPEHSVVGVLYQAGRVGADPCSSFHRCGGDWPRSLVEAGLLVGGARPHKHLCGGGRRTELCDYGTRHLLGSARIFLRHVARQRWVTDNRCDACAELCRGHSVSPAAGEPISSWLCHRTRALYFRACCSRDD